MKKMMAVFMVLLTMLCGCAGGSDVKRVKADMSGYQNLKDADHVFVETDVKGFLRHLDEKDTFAAYFGFVGCPWCAEVVPILNDEAKKNGIETVYYINTRPNENVHKNTEIPDYDLLLKGAGEWLDYNNDGEHQLYVPFVYFVKDGEVQSVHQGTVDGHDAHERTMTEEEAAQVHQELSDGFAGMK